MGLSVLSLSFWQGGVPRQTESVRILHVDESLDPEEATQIREEMDSGDRYELEGSYRQRDGTTFPVEVRLQRLDIDFVE